MIVQREPIDADDTAALSAGVWAGFYPDAVIPVRAGWLAGVMERAGHSPADLTRYEGSPGEHSDRNADNYEHRATCHICREVDAVVRTLSRAPVTGYHDDPDSAVEGVPF